MFFYSLSFHLFYDTQCSTHILSSISLSLRSIPHYLLCLYTASSPLLYRIFIAASLLFRCCFMALLSSSYPRLIFDFFITSSFPPLFPSFPLFFFILLGEEKTRRNQLTGDCTVNSGYRYQDIYIPHDPSGTLPAPGFDGIGIVESYPIC